MAENRTLKGIYGEAGHSDYAAAKGAIADAQFHTLTWAELTDNGEDGGSADADRKLAETTDSGTTDPQTVPAGVTLYGQISKFQLHSGAVIAYKASK